MIELSSKDKFYFVHSFMAKDNKHTLANSNYNTQKLSSLIKIKKRDKITLNLEIIL